MDKKSIEQIIKKNAFPDLPDHTELIETHISWVILTKNFAYKIKKTNPILFPVFFNTRKTKILLQKRSTAE